MRGTGAVGWGNEVVYAYLTTIGKTVRLRVSVDEADRLDVVAGQRVRLTLPGCEPAELLVTAVNSMPPFVWVELTSLVASRAS
jgi:hypothetical protein